MKKQRNINKPPETDPNDMEICDLPDSELKRMFH
jgi:hypothetical protein